MKLHLWPFVSGALGFVLLAAAGADGHEILKPGQDEDWLLLRADLELLGGLWMLSGTSPRWSRRLAITIFVGLLIGDVAWVVIDHAPRDIWGRVAAGSPWILCVDLVIVSALVRWRPLGSQTAWVDARPGQVIRTALLAMTLGAGVDWFQIGRFPIVATARAGGPSSSRGLDYLVYLPEGYHRYPERWPLILALHGAGAVGGDINMARAEGVPRYVESGRKLPFVVLAPHSPKQGWDVGALDALIEEVLGRYHVDARRVYLTGASMGGYGTWALATERPGRFAAIAPICGGGEPADAVLLRGVPVWAFHGAEDRVVPLKASQAMVTAIEHAGGEVRLTVYPGVGHDAATPTYADRRLYRWFLKHRLSVVETNVNTKPK